MQSHVTRTFLVASPSLLTLEPSRIPITIRLSRDDFREKFRNRNQEQNKLQRIPSLMNPKLDAFIPPTACELVSDEIDAVDFVFMSREIDSDFVGFEIP